MSDLETRLERRARKAYAQAVAARADALARECSERKAHHLDRKAAAARRSYVQALRLADLEVC